MKLNLLRSVFLLSFVLISFSGVYAQRNVTPTLDPILEADAKHNLDVAMQAFNPLKKAYKQVIMRFEETYAAYPEFSGMGTFLYIAGMSSYYLSNNKGKQKITVAMTEDEKKKYAPEKLREDATMYLTMLVQKYPKSKHKSDAEKTLKELESASQK